MGKIESVDLDLSTGPDFEQDTKGELLSRREKLEGIKNISDAKPSAYHAELRSKLREKEILNFGQLPKFIVDEFDRLKDENKLNRRHFFYKLLRDAGADIPSDDLLDGRKL